MHGLVFRLTRRISDRHVDGRHAGGHACELARHRRDHLGLCPLSACLEGDDDGYGPLRLLHGTLEVVKLVS